MEVTFSAKNVEIAVDISAPDSVEMIYDPRYAGPYEFDFGGHHGFIDPQIHEISSPYKVRVEATIQNRRYRAHSVTATQLLSGVPVGAGELARIPVVAMLEAIAETVPMFVQWGGREWGIETAPELADKLQQSLTEFPGTPHIISQMYRVLKLTHQKPTAEMASRMGVNDVTVRRWLATAVKQGLLSQDERGR